MIPRQRQKNQTRWGVWVGILLLSLSVIGLPSCAPLFSRQPNLVLVMVDSLAEQDYLCSDSPLFEDLEHLRGECERLIRFTHVFTPSPYLQAQIASLVAGQEPAEHGVRTNGAVAIDAKTQVLAELSLRQKMRTAFLSGGVPLQNKFGLSQGYELFNDSFDQVPAKPFRPVAESVGRAVRWLDEEVEGSAFHLALYVPDLLVPAKLLTAESNEELGVSRQGRLKNIYQAVDQLIGALKQRKKWAQTHFVFIGVGEYRAQLNPLNPLGSLTTQVPLQVKLAKGTKANLSSMSRELISFAQIGRWIAQILEHRTRREELKLTLQRISDEYIPQEWPVWSWLGVSDWPWLALRSKALLFTTHKDFQIYESLTDRTEVEPLSAAEAGRIIEEKSLSRLLLTAFAKDCQVLLSKEQHKALGCPESPLVNLPLLEQLNDLHQQVLRAGADSSSPMNTANPVKTDKTTPAVVRGWLAMQALKARDWAGLFELGRVSQEKSWMLLAQLNLREPTSEEVPGCLRYFRDPELSTSHFYQVCQDSELRKIVDGLEHLRKKRKPGESFWAQLSSMKQLRQAKMINVQMLFKNDVQDFQRLGPSLAELYFFIPENLEFVELLDLDKV